MYSGMLFFFSCHCADILWSRELLLNILRHEKADGCKLCPQGFLITFQCSNPLETDALISYIKF